jgi:hypothetical protein
MTVATSAEHCCRVNERGWSLHLHLSPTAVRVRSPGVAAVDHTKTIVTRPFFLTMLDFKHVPMREGSL